VNLPQGLSAGIGDYFRTVTIENAGKNKILIIFLIKFIGKKYQNRSKRKRLVSKSLFYG